MMTVSAMRALDIETGEWPEAEPPAQLSTDYLNRYGEALMLLEMAPMDPGVIDDLKSWRAVGYVEHFENSNLRCTPSALAAYRGLAAARRQAFEELCVAMNRLIATATSLLADLEPDQGTTEIVAVASESLRTLIGRATQFINANGDVDVGALQGGGLQDEIDAVFAS